ncbi:uncharacterized protein [Haliotis asinina]|uniref:uncharacterized protein isoform X2 n=1 Tax=Haliotis asinina TaxID=109174 RepID=UPI003531CB13
MWRKYLLPVTLTLCVISDVISGTNPNSGPGRNRLTELDYRRDFVIGPHETDVQIPVDYNPTVLNPILLSMMCAYCREHRIQSCIDRICSRTTAGGAGEEA